MGSSSAIIRTARLLGAASSTLLAVGLVAACTNYDPRDYDEDPPASVLPSASPAPSVVADPSASPTPDTATEQRILLLAFSRPIMAADIEAVLQDGLDTSS